MLSDVPKTFLGAVTFGLDRSAYLFHNALARARPILGTPMATQAIGWVLVTLMLIGWFVSLARPRQKRFALGLAFLIGVAGHLALSYGTILPYGEMRYFLPFACFFPVFAAIGATDSLGAVYWGVRRLPFRVGGREKWLAHHGIHPSPVLLNALLLLMLLCAGLVTARLVLRNQALAHQVEQGYKALSNARKSESPGIVLDDWTAVTLRDTYPGILDEDSYVLETDRRSRKRGENPSAIESMNRWKDYLDSHENLFGVTSMPFKERYYGPVFALAVQRFRVLPVVSAKTLHFFKLGLKAPDKELLDSTESFSADSWRRTSVAIVAVSQDSSQGAFLREGIIEQRVPIVVGKGEVLVFSIALRAEQEVPGFRLVLKRGDKGQRDGTAKRITVDDQPRRYIVRHEFQRSWQHVAVQIVGPPDTEATVLLRKPTLLYAITPAQ